MMLKAVIDTEAGNENIRNGSMGNMIEQMMQQLNPEAVYFQPEDGKRSCIVVFDMVDPSQIPAVSEPMFLGAKARVTIVPCMNMDDLQKGLSQLPPELLSDGA